MDQLHLVYPLNLLSLLVIFIPYFMAAVNLKLNAMFIFIIGKSI